MPSADNNGVRSHYQVEGDGPPLVLQASSQCHFFSLPELDHAAGFREAGLVLPYVTKFLRENS